MSSGKGASRRPKAVAALETSREAQAVAASGRYGHKGFAAAMRLVTAAAGEDAADIFAAFARWRVSHPDSRIADLTTITVEVGFGVDSGGSRTRLLTANKAFYNSFGIALFEATSSHLPADVSDDCQALGGQLTISQKFIDVVDRPPALAPPADVVLDVAATTWSSIAVAASRSDRGHHLVLRAGDDDLGDRGAAAAFAAEVAARGGRVIRVHGEPRDILSAELYGAGSAVIVVSGNTLVRTASDVAASDDMEFFEEAKARPREGALQLTPLAERVMGWLGLLSNTYVWTIPLYGELPKDLRRVVGGCIGSVRQDAAWQAAHVASVAPGIGHVGTQALLAQTVDARDVGAMAALAVVIAAMSLPGRSSVDASSRFVAASFGHPEPAKREPERLGAKYDERLFACDEDGIALLGRGGELALGGRVLAYGPPGGGKSTYAQMLAARVAEHGGGSASILVEPAMLLVRAWGATERLLATLWDRAAREGATIIADEFDSMGALRETDAPVSGNAYLIRCLTNEWLRLMDRYPQVAFIATVNDLQALDPAIRRRFSILIEVRDELAPDQERLAWRAILGLEPPPDWTACGASVADVAAARDRCRLLGRVDARSLAAAVAKSRNARLAPRSAARNARKGNLH